MAEPGATTTRPRRSRVRPHPLGKPAAAAIRFRSLRRLLSALAPKRGGHLTISITSKAGERVAATFSHPALLRLMRGALAQIADEHGALARPADSPWHVGQGKPWVTRRENNRGIERARVLRTACELLDRAGAVLTVLAPGALTAALSALDSLPAAEAA